MGTPVVPLGHPRLAFVKGPTSAETLCGMSGGVCILSLGWGKESGSVLFWSWPGEQGGDLLCGAEDLSYLHGCAFRAGFREQCSPWGILWHTSLQALCIGPVLLLLSQCHLGWAGLGTQARGVLSVRCLVRIRTVAGAAPLPRQAHMSAC